MKHKSKHIPVAFVIVLASMTLGADAQTCLDADQYPDQWPDSRYTVNDNATVLDTKTNLIWMHCSAGQAPLSSSCDGTASTYTWESALAQTMTTNSIGFAGFTDWRLPNIKELASLAKLNCISPAINEIIFPNTVADWYWSASPYAGDSNFAWLLDFNYGNDNANDRSTNLRVRLVRAGQ